MPGGRRHYRVTLADAYAAHLEALSHGGGAEGISNLNSLKGALGRPYHGYHKPIEKKAAALFHGIATSHGFIDANKRTAWLLTLLMIERSGYLLLLNDDDRLDDVAVDVVNRDMSETDLVDWLKARLEKAE